MTAVLLAISVIGMAGLPLGDPKFFHIAIGLEASFITLTILSVKRVRYVVIPNIVIACVIIAGNMVSPTHTNIMLTPTPIYNALILITGGYLLQGLLISSVITYRNMKRIAKDKVDYID